MRTALALFLVAAAANIGVSAASCRPFKNLMTIVLENEDASNVMKDPYMGTTLPAKGYLLTNSYGVTHPSQPNYIAQIAGDTLWVLGDYDVNLGDTNIVDLLEAKSLTWKSYQENYPSAGCNLDSTYGGKSAYARKHNPFISFKNIQNNATRCANIVPSSQLDIDAAAGKLPNYMYYTPNLLNDGHDSSLLYGSNWLKSFLEPKLTDPAYADTLFYITFDESECYLCSNKIYSILVGKGIKGAGLTDNTKYDHYSFLATWENAFGIGNLGRNDAKATPVPLASC
ncbi:phosphoesterase family-domain-containing protein [Cladochytrium replicatum]|nr:phosphoesterase family-domain-containing protein [Cladochytrium replicatum]